MSSILKGTYDHLDKVESFPKGNMTLIAWPPRRVLPGVWLLQFLMDSATFQVDRSRRDLLFGSLKV